jgi:hypothetical protein
MKNAEVKARAQNPIKLEAAVGMNREIREAEGES